MLALFGSPPCVYTYNGVVSDEPLKPVRWVGSSLKDLRSFPEQVRREIGHALYAAQNGEMDPAAKPLKGFGGGSVLEVVARHDGGAWRTIYTVRFPAAVYVLHVFQKKSNQTYLKFSDQSNRPRRRVG
jgi:phage-related protein